MMNRALLLIIVLCITACSEQNFCSVSNPEKFETFFERYTHNKSFATQRTEFPLEFLKWEFRIEDAEKDDISPATSNISANEFEKWPTIYELTGDSPITSEVKKLGLEATTVHMMKPDTDYSVTYSFKMLNGCWSMWRIEDATL